MKLSVFSIIIQLLLFNKKKLYLPEFRPELQHRWEAADLENKEKQKLVSKLNHILLGNF
jgi:hypothetical protein